MKDIRKSAEPRKNKKAPYFGALRAHEKIRTSTQLNAPPPQDGVSTNFTTCALAFSRSAKVAIFDQFENTNPPLKL